MTKKRILLFLSIALCFGLGLVWFKAPEMLPVVESKSPKIDIEARQINGRKVTGLTKGKEAEELKVMTITNEVSPEWRQEVVKGIMAQGGDAVKKVLVEKVESLIWNQNGQGINVESVIIRVTDKNNEETALRALVDSESGRILQNWDQPINDPMNPRDNPGVKLDPRYHND